MSHDDAAGWYRPTEEHEAFRAAVREVCDAKVAPYAAEVDELAEFPKASLRGAAGRATSTPARAGGVRRGGCRRARHGDRDRGGRPGLRLDLADPGGQQAGLVPWLLAGSEELKAALPAAVARGDAMASYCLSEPEAGSDAVSMRTRAVRDGDHWVLNGVKRWITNAGVSEYYTVFAVTDPDARAKGISAFVVEKSDDGRLVRGAGEEARHQGLADLRGLPRQRADPGRPHHRRPRAPASRTAMRTLDHTRVTIAAQAVGIAQGALDYALGYVQERKQFGKAIAEFQGLQFMLADMGMKLEAARQLTYAPPAAPSAATPT